MMLFKFEILWTTIDFYLLLPNALLGYLSKRKPFFDIKGNRNNFVTSQPENSIISKNIEQILKKIIIFVNAVCYKIQHIL